MRNAADMRAGVSKQIYCTPSEGRAGVGYGPVIHAGFTGDQLEGIPAVAVSGACVERKETMLRPPQCPLVETCYPGHGNANQNS